MVLSLISIQAFSHFTFERSGHQLIVVDIQGEITNCVMLLILLYSISFSFIFIMALLCHVSVHLLFSSDLLLLMLFIFKLILLDI